MNATQNEEIRIEREVRASPVAVFAALTTREGFSRWFGGESVAVPLDLLEYEPCAGRPWTARMVLPDGGTIDWAGTFVEVSPPGRYAFTLTDRPDSPERLLASFTLSGTGAGTLLVFTQEVAGFGPAQRDATAAGWESFIDVIAAISSDGP